MRKFFPIIFITFFILFFLKSFFSHGFVPIPADTIIGLFHPYRDLYADTNPNGIAYKNALITDPVEQQYPWRHLTIAIEQKLQLPIWNRYAAAGTPLLANMQSAPLYPLNLLFLIFPFSFSWSFLIFLEPLLAGLFLYFYLKNLMINTWASIFGAVSFAFCGFSVAWMEWGTIVHVGLWLPLILLSIDKVFLHSRLKSEKLKMNPSADGEKLQFKIKKYAIWPIIFLFSLMSSFFAGHLQTFFYTFVISFLYLVCRSIQYKSKEPVILFISCIILFAIITAIQWIPFLQYVQLSARDIDVNWQGNGWFIPWEHLIQFLVPDFFGNPTTGNYWGVWNYGEFIGYVGILPFIMSITALFFRRDKKTFFYGTIFFLSLVFALPTFFAKIPFLLQIPLLSTAQPTRLLFLIDFSLCVLAAFGLDYFMKEKKVIRFPLFSVGFLFILIWYFVLFSKSIIPAEHLIISKHNLALPTSIFIIETVFIILLLILNKKRIGKVLLLLLIVLSLSDLLRFADKFLPFTPSYYLFPQTKILSFLQVQNNKNFRILETDRRIFPPNFSTIYHIQSIDNYDPLYLRRYGELIIAMQRNEPDISAPFGFHRIITPQNYESHLADLLGVKYILSLSDLESPKLTKVMQEGQTRLFESKTALPRAFFVKSLVFSNDKNQAIKELFLIQNYGEKAVVETKNSIPSKYLIDKNLQVSIFYPNENKITIQTNNNHDGFLVLTDTYYPTWQAFLYSKEERKKEIPIYRTDYNFRGILVPPGKHTIIMTNSLF